MVPVVSPTDVFESHPMHHWDATYDHFCVHLVHFAFNAQMEIMGKFGLTRGDENGAGALAWDPTEVRWEVSHYGDIVSRARSSLRSRWLSKLLLI